MTNGEFDKPKSTRTRKFLGIGCLAIIIIVVLIGAYIIWNYKNMVATRLRTIVAQVVEKSDLPDDQKNQIKQYGEQLANDIQSGKITMPQLGAVAKELEQGPVFPLAMLHAAQITFVRKSDLSDEQKADADLALQRYSRGIVERTIQRDQVDETLSQIQEQDKKGNRKLKTTLSTEELETLIAQVKQQADDAGVPNESYQVNLAHEVRIAIDRAMAPPTTTQPTQPATQATTQPTTHATTESTAQ